jgi:hypothetical protein
VTRNGVHIRIFVIRFLINFYFLLHGTKQNKHTYKTSVGCILVGRPEGRRPLGRPRRRWEGNIKMDLRETGFGDVDWIHWAQDRGR